MLINTLRPSSVRKAGLGTAVPSGTLSAVTSDNSDATYIRSLVSNSGVSGRNWNLRLESHVLTAGYQRHAIRGRIRASSDTGTVVDDIDVGRGASDFLAFASRVPITAGFAEYSTNWFQNTSFNLADPATISDLNIGGGWAYNDGPEITGTEVRTAECYIDIDCRFHPDYDPEIQDNAGVDQSGSTITDTNQPVLYFGVVGYDDLPALDWSVTLRQGATVLQTDAGTGVPPAQVEVQDPLANGAYEADFVVRSTVRGADPFAWAITRTFTVDNVSPPPSPPLMTVVEQDGGYLVSWEYAGGQPWDSDYVVAELWRDDCTGSQRIATLPDALTGSYLDLAVPQLDPQPTGPDCTDEAAACDITYRVRYWGYVSATIEVPDTIPDGLILGWPGTAGTIPSGWSRVTDLDTRYPRGATTTAAPSATGGAAGHTHSAPAHLHSVRPHDHELSGLTNPTFDSGVNTDAADNAYAISRSAHRHGYPSAVGITPGRESSTVTPATSSANNLPPTREVIWIQSAGAQVAFPVGVLGFSAESISGWTADTASSGRYLRGAAAAGNGGASNGAATHSHTVNAHTHTTPTHSHTSGPTGISDTVSSQDGEAGSRVSQFIPRHTHPITVSTENYGGLNSASGGSTSTVNLEPPHRRLRVLRNTAGGIQTRIIGLYVGAIADLNATLTWCNGSNGTPDMRTWFAREAGGNSVNSTGGTSSHSHTVGNHEHTSPFHQHSLTIGPSTAYAPQTRTGQSQINVADPAHTHTSAPTGATAVESTASGAGTTTSTSHLPLYREVHFVRLDGIVPGGPLPVPEQRITEFSSVTVPAFTYADGLDRLATLDEKIAVATDRSHDYPRLVIDSTPLRGGLHTVATQPGGEDMTLSIPAVGKREIDQLELVLRSERVYFSPLGGTPGWYAPAGWSVTSPTPGVWSVSIALTRQPWPDTDEPGAYL